MNKKFINIFVSTLLLSLVLVGCSSNKSHINTSTDVTSSKTEKFSGCYEKDIKTFKSSFVKKAPSIDEYETSTPPSSVSEIKYESDGLKLKAWISNHSKNGVKYPAIVFMHGGFAFDKRDWDIAKYYVNQGYVAMTPMVRGENGNPGNFEYFYGEVKDCIAAGNYLSKLSYIDKNNIFLMGHSAGGSLCVLSSLTNSPYKAIATSGACYGTEIYFQQKKDRIPFEFNKDEIHIRSSYNYVKNMKTPVFSFVGEDDEGILYLSTKFEKKAKKFNVPYHLKVIPGDHISSLYKAVELSTHIFDDYVKHTKNKP